MASPSAEERAAFVSFGLLASLRNAALSSSLPVASSSDGGFEPERGNGNRFEFVGALFRHVFTGNCRRGAIVDERLVLLAGLLALLLAAAWVACCLRCLRRSSSCCCAWSSINDTVSLNMDRLELLGFSGVACADLLVSWRAPKSESSSSSDAMAFRLRAVGRLGMVSSESPSWSSLEIARRRRFLAASGRVARDGAEPSSLESSRTITFIADAGRQQTRERAMQPMDRYLAQQQRTSWAPAIEQQQPQQSPQNRRCKRGRITCLPS